MPRLLHGVSKPQSRFDAPRSNRFQIVGARAFCGAGPPISRTPLIRSVRARKGSDGEDETRAHARVQAGGGGIAAEQRSAADAERGRPGSAPTRSRRRDAEMVRQVPLQWPGAIPRLRPVDCSATPSYGMKWRSRADHGQKLETGAQEGTAIKNATVPKTGGSVRRRVHTFPAQLGDQGINENPYFCRQASVAGVDRMDIDCVALRVGQKADEVTACD